MAARIDALEASVDKMSYQIAAIRQQHSDAYAENAFFQVTGKLAIIQGREEHLIESSRTSLAALAGIYATTRPSQVLILILTLMQAPWLDYGSSFIGTRASQGAYVASRVAELVTGRWTALKESWMLPTTSRPVEAGGEVAVADAVEEKPILVVGPVASSEAPRYEVMAGGDHPTRHMTPPEARRGRRYKRARSVVATISQLDAQTSALLCSPVASSSSSSASTASPS